MKQCTGAEDKQQTKPASKTPLLLGSYVKGSLPDVFASPTTSTMLAEAGESSCLTSGGPQLPTFALSWRSCHIIIIIINNNILKMKGTVFGIM